ncbi:hypothetical protein GCM10028895_44000 [Pontibacter rugosus]
MALKKWPPRQINWLYGFRTHYAMRNQQNWDEANQYHPKLLIKIGLIAILTGWILSLFLTPVVALLILVALLVVMLAASIVITNQHLKRKYGS